MSTPRCRVDVDHQAGGRIAQITFDGQPQLLGRGDTDDTAFGWGSYPMVPWAGRIRRGRFSFDGDDCQLEPNMGVHAIHGVGYRLAWSVDAESAISSLHSTIEMSCALTSPDWPFGGTAHQVIAVIEDEAGVTVEMDLSVTADRRPLPISMGWHPWFLKPERLSFSPTAQYQRDEDWITVADTTPPRPGPWDDTFINSEPVVLHYPDRTVTVTSPLTTWVVFDMPVKATCVEPQTAPPDAFNISPTRLEPGETITASCALRWESAGSPG